MDALLGFVVLTGPLVPLILWSGFLLWVTKMFTRNIESSGKRRLVRVGLFVVLLLLPFGDEIAGNIYFEHLCKTEAGAKVYQTIELPAEYWDKDGNPKFYDERTGNSTLDITQYTDTESNKALHLFGIEEQTSILLDKTTHKIISTNTLFRYWGGWMKRNLSPHNTASHCGGKSKDLVDKLFKQKQQ